MKRFGTLDVCGAPDFLAWNVGETPILNGPIPPFFFTSKSETAFKWLLHEAIKSGLRKVIDVSNVIAAVRIDQGIKTTSKEGDKSTSLTQNYLQSLESTVEDYLAQSYGTYSVDIPFSLHNSPFKLLSCKKKGSAGYCVEFNKNECSCASETDDFPPEVMISPCFCKKPDINGKSQCEQPQRFSPRVLEGVEVPISLEELLSQMASPQKTIVLLVAAKNYLELLMTFICGLRRLNVSNYVVAALDKETLHFGTLQVTNQLFFQWFLFMEEK